MKKVLPLLFVALVSFLVIFIKFNLIHKNLTFDEVEFAKLALSLNGKPYVPYSTMATGHSTLYFYLILASLKLFGITNFALRLPSAIFGVLGSVMFYLLMAKIFKKNFFLAFGLSILFATTRWYFNFARFSFEATFLLFLELTSIYFLISYEKKYIYLSLSGLFAGLAFNSYTPGRFFFLIPPIYVLMTSLHDKKHLVKKILAYAIPFVIAITPLTTYLMTHPDNRVDKLFFWKNHEMTWQQKVSGTVENLVSVTSMFVWKGDMSGKHNYPGKPALNPIIGLFFIIGMLVAIRKIKNPMNALFVGYLGLSLLPSMMIYPWENPNMLRTFTSIPSVIYFVGLVSYEILDRNRKVPLMAIIAATLFLTSSFYELRTYFVYQTKVFPSAFETKPTLPETLKHTNFKY